ncbi:putative gamma interferon inducible lysosomal thiol reductase GILT [Rosa chinensis]|uniref:Putative gamma interferon inducible lysosomal thiol reductase GILT n=1 Tax=Rosa chinensis TaxID=74649 RepID=A0A2P6PC47_ROSCH|nr:putative gamma interferon inducible lysosomal thiol reductase GILT [Rosa chinensis]
MGGVTALFLRSYIWISEDEVFFSRMKSLSTSCASFIVKNLAKIFDDDLITILNLRLHRPDGCKLNFLEACAIDVMHDVNKHFALIYCIEFLGIKGRHKEWETCFSSLGLPKKPTLDCYNSSKNATKLEQNYGNETMHLNPPLKFVPWLVLNDQPIGNVGPLSLSLSLRSLFSPSPVFSHTRSISLFESKLTFVLMKCRTENFAGYVCKAYKGNIVPKACQSVHLKQKTE